jgi:hypothetical protein
MKKNSKKEKEGELWPLMLQPSFCYKIHNYCLCQLCIYYLIFQTWHWVFQEGGEKQKLEKERLWLLMHELSSSPASYVQASYSSILSTNVLHYTESFILLFLILFLKGSSSRQPDSGKSGIWHAFICKLSNKFNKSKQTRYLEINCENWSIRVVQNIIYSSITGLKPVLSVFLI